jgi:TolB protein
MFKQLLKQIKCKWLITITLLLTTQSHAQVQGELTFDDAGLPVATAHFVNETSAPVNITDIIRSDLSRSGDLVNFPVGGATIGLDGANPAEWGAKGAHALVVGNVTAQGDTYTVRLRLFDATKKTSLGDYALTVPASGLRSAGHRMADFVYEKLMGMRGAFSTRLSYVDRVNGKYQLLISDSDGAGAQIALNSNEPIISPSWSPSGTQVAYVSFEQKKPVVYIHDLPTGQRTMIANYKGNNSAPSWSPDGQNLVLALSQDGNTQVFQVSAKGGGLQRLTRSTGSVIDTEPTYAPDGSTIYFTSDRGGEPQIYKMPAAGESSAPATRVTFKGKYNTSARISPDGTKMAYISGAAGGYQTHIMDLKYGDSFSISNTSRDESPSFAANGQVVLYSTNLGGREVLRASSIDGRMQQELPLPSGKARFPAWGPFMK